MKEKTADIIKVQEEKQVDDERKWCVYCHTNLFNGKKYVGITSKNPKHRWSNGNGYKNNSHFSRAIKKYGWNNFKHEILLLNESYDYACRAEVCLIKHYKLTNDKYGYNITEGGQGTCGIRRFGQDNPNYGNHKLAGKNNPSYGKYYRCTMVYSIELRQMFFGSREAERCTGADHSGIIKSCKSNKQKICGRHPATGEPLHWKYVYDQEQKDGSVIKGAITLGYITEEQVNEYLSSLRQKGNDT